MRRSWFPALMAALWSAVSVCVSQESHYIPFRIEFAKSLLVSCSHLVLMFIAVVSEENNVVVKPQEVQFPVELKEISPFAAHHRHLQIFTGNLQQGFANSLHLL